MNRKKRGTLWIVMLATVVVSIPACGSFVDESKTREAESNLRRLYRAAALHYTAEDWSSRSVVGAAPASHCTVPSAVTPNAPGEESTRVGPLPESFQALDFELPDPVYYRYEIVALPGCNHPPNTAIYSFRARGDLDGDGDLSLFEISAGTNARGELHHPGIYRSNELE